MSPHKGPFSTQIDIDQVDRLLATIESSKVLVSAYDMETLLTAILVRIKAIMPAKNWSLLLIDPKKQELYFAVVVGVMPETLKDVRLKLGEGIAGTVAQTGIPIFIPDVHQDHRFSTRVDTATGFDTRSIIALPLLVRGEVIGVFEVVNIEDEKFFRKKYLPHLIILADYVAIAVDNVRNLQRLEARTFIDEVTGFFNTRYLIQELDRLIAQHLSRSEPFSVVFLDLDNFKRVVDTYGHLQGSRVLAQVAWVIHKGLGPDDSLVRYGGDEFVILMPRRTRTDALDITRRLRLSLNSTPFLQYEGLNIKITASYGIATVPEDAQDCENLLHIADRAMFGSKGRGRDCIMFGRDLTEVKD